MLRSDPTPRQEQKPKPKKNNTQPKTVPGRATSRLAVDVTPTPRGLVAALLSLPYGEKKNPFSCALRRIPALASAATRLPDTGAASEAAASLLQAPAACSSLPCPSSGTHCISTARCQRHGCDICLTSAGCISGCRKAEVQAEPSSCIRCKCCYKKGVGDLRGVAPS